MGLADRGSGVIIPSRRVAPAARKALHRASEAGRHPVRQEARAAARGTSAPRRDSGAAQDGFARKPGRSDKAAHSRVDIRALPTERKYVTILCADLQRSTDLIAGLDLEEGLARLEPALTAMRGAVHAFGGIVYKEMGDGLFAVFGAPVAEDLHAVMACHAGLDLTRRIAELRDPTLHARVGVHAGLVVAGFSSADYTQSYDLGGPPLIMAERLQAAAAPDQVLASEACRSLAEGYIRFGRGAALDLKGFPRPVTVHVVEGVGELSKWRVSLARGTAAFVGREAEQARLRALAGQVEATGAGACVALLGEPGVGKSRLVHETLQVLPADGWQLIEAECSPILGRSPYSLLKELLRAAARAAGEAELATLRHRLPPAPAAALAVMLDAGPAPPAWASLAPRARARAITEAARAVAECAFAGRRTALLIEDLQWADQASAPAVEAVVALAGRHRLLLLATARSGGLPEWLARHEPVLLPLRPLEAASGLAMLDNLLGPSPRLAALKRRILDHTGALPLFIEEVCRGLAEAGALTGKWGAFEPASPAADLGVPPTVQGVIAGRIDRLSPPEKRLLQVAAACGPRVPGHLLRVVCGLTGAVFRDCLTALVGAAMLVPVPVAEPAAADSLHAFPHELVRQVAYDAVLGQDKVALHAQILAELERQAGSMQGGPDLSGALAHHALMAREWSRAADYAAAIARQCLAQSALPDATRYFETAMQAVDRLEPSPGREARAIDLRIEARLAYANFGKVARWLEFAGEAERRASAMGDARRRTTALATRAAALNFVGPAVEALEASRQAVAAAKELGDRSAHAYASYGLGQSLYHAGRFDGAVSSLEHAFRAFTAEQVRPPPGTEPLHLPLLCCMMLCICHCALGHLQAAAAAQDRAEALAAAGARPYDKVAAGLGRGSLLLGHGQAAAALEVLDAAHALAQQNDIQLFLGVLGYQRGLAALCADQPERARKALAEAAGDGGSVGHRTVLLRATIYAALACLPGDEAEALERAAAATRAARQEGYAGIEIEGLIAEARLQAMLGDTDAARARARAAAALATECGAAPSRDEALMLIRQVDEGQESRARSATATGGRMAFRS